MKGKIVPGDSNSSNLTDEPSSLGSNRTNSTTAASRPLEIHNSTSSRRSGKNSTIAATTHHKNVTVVSSNSTNTTRNLVNTTFTDINMENETILLDHLKKVKAGKKRKGKRREKTTAQKESPLEQVEEQPASDQDPKSYLRGKPSRKDKTTKVQ